MSREIQIISLRAAYLETEPILDPVTEEPQINAATGREIRMTKRLSAKRGQTVTVSDSEARRLIEQGAARTPSTAPLPGSERVATPFGIPLRQEDDDVSVYYQGPIMGDPTPGPGSTAGATVGGLTPEESARIEEEARAAAGKEESEYSFIWEEDTTADDVKAFVEANDLNVDETVALASSDGANDEYDLDRVNLVLEAETSREKPRKGVVEPLEELAEEGDTD